MSWLKFTDNLTKLKDEVTNFATEVLAPDMPEGENQGAVSLDQKLAHAEQNIEDLTNLCTAQDAEVRTNVGVK